MPCPRRLNARSAFLPARLCFVKPKNYDCPFGILWPADQHFHSTALPENLSLLRTSFTVCRVQVTDFPPAGKALQGTDVPRRFAGDGAKVGRAEELHQINLRNVVDIVFPERLDVPLIAPVVDGGFSVAGDFGNYLCGQHVGIAGEQLGIIQPQMFPHDWGNLFFHLDSIIAFIPARRGGVAFGEHLAVFQIGNHILLFDFVAACFPACVFAGDFPALEQVQGGGFADVANAIQLIFRDYIGDIVPVDCVFFHDNTPHILIIFVGIRTVRVLPFHFCSFRSFRSSFQKRKNR